MIKHHMHVTCEHANTLIIFKARYDELPPNLSTSITVDTFSIETATATEENTRHTQIINSPQQTSSYSSLELPALCSRQCQTDYPLFCSALSHHLDLHPYRSVQFLLDNEPQFVCLTTAFEKHNQVIAVYGRHWGKSEDPKRSLTFCLWLNFSVAQLLAAKNPSCINCLKGKEGGGSQGLHHYVLLSLLYTYSCRKGFWLRQL